MKLKRIFSALLVIAVICSVASINVFAAVEPIDLTSTGGSVKIYNLAGSYYSYIINNSTDKKAANFSVTADDSFTIQQRSDKAGVGFRVEVSGLTTENLDNNDIRYVEISMDVEELVNFATTSGYILTKGNYGNSPYVTQSLSGRVEGIISNTKLAKELNEVFNVRFVVDRETETSYVYTDNMLDGMIVGGTCDDTFTILFSNKANAAPGVDTDTWNISNLQIKGWKSDATSKVMDVYVGKKEGGKLYRTISYVKGWGAANAGRWDGCGASSTTWFATYDNQGKLIDVGKIGNGVTNPTPLELEEGSSNKTFVWNHAASNASPNPTPIHMAAEYLDLDK